MEQIQTWNGKCIENNGRRPGIIELLLYEFLLALLIICSFYRCIIVCLTDQASFQLTQAAKPAGMCTVKASNFCIY